MKKYENLSKEVERQINDKLNMLEKRKSIMTEKERQYSFIRLLDTLPLTEKEIFNIYTNTTL